MTKSLQTKICSKCKIEKASDKFSKDKRSKDGLNWQCKACEKAYRLSRSKEIKAYTIAHKKKAKIYRKTHQKRIRAWQKLYVESHREERKIKDKAYREAHKEEKKIRDKLYRETHKKEIKARDKKCYKTHIERRKAQGKIYRENNKDKIKARDKKYYNVEKQRLYRKIHAERYRSYKRTRYKTDPKYKLNHNISVSIRGSLKNGKGGIAWLKLVDYTLQDLKKHLEKQFIEGMTWENHGKNGWEIDHKIPISVFNFTKPEHRDFKRCWALKNLQPLWSKDNLKKKASLNKHFQPSLKI